MKHFMFAILKFAFSIIFLWFLIHTSKLDFTLFPDLLHAPLLLSITIFMYVIVVFISTWRWYQLNKVQQIAQPYTFTLLPTYLGVAFNNLLPGGVGGDFFRFYFLNKKIPAKKSVVMLSVLFDRVTGLTGIFLIVGLTALFNLSLFSHQPMMLYFMLVSFFLCTSIVIVYLLSAFLPNQIGLTTWLTKKFTGKKWLKSVISLLEALRVYRNSKKVIANCLIASIIIQGFIAITCMLIAKMMHLDNIAFSHYVMAIAMTQIVNLIPISPGGFGIGEFAFANTLVLLDQNISGTYATVFLAYRLIGILVYLPGVIVFIFDKNLLQKQQAFNEELSREV